MAFRDLNFELGADGPKFVWQLIIREPSIEQIVAKKRRKLRIGLDVAPLAQRGIPHPEDPEPSAKERQIRTVHEGLVCAVDKAAKRARDKKAAALSQLGTDITDADFTQAVAEHGATLGQVRSGFPGTMTPLLDKKIKAESALAAFDRINNTSDQSTARSLVEFIGTTIITASVESLFNGLMFKEQMGYFAAVGFTFGVGASLAVIGTVAGIGWAGIKRRQALRKWGGALLFLTGVAIAAFFILAMAHYREALVAGSADPAQAAQVTLLAAPLAPAFDMSLLPYVFVNIAGLWLVAIKAAQMFGWLDLRRRRKAVERSVRDVQESLADALDACEAAKLEAVDQIDAVVERTTRNAAKGKTLFADAQEIAAEHAESMKVIAGSYVECQQEYREIVRSVHPAGKWQPRFDMPITMLDYEPLAIEPGLYPMVTALEARMVKARAEKPQLVEAVFAETSDMQAGLYAMLEEIEQDIRRDRPKPDPTIRAVS